MSITDALDRLFGQCQTRNQLNALFIRLENNITPQELADLWQALFLSDSYWRSERSTNTSLPVAEVRDATRAWLSSFTALAGLRSGETPEPFTCQVLGNDVKFFSNGANPSGKTLLIGMAGQLQRLMLPIAVFLQALPAARADLLLLQDSQRDGFRTGVVGVANNFEDLLSILPRVFKFDQYRRRCMIGTSGGGLPAILAGLAFGADVAMSVGGNSPRDFRWSGQQAPIARSLLARASRQTTRLVAVYGVNSEKDRLAAVELSELVPAKLIGVSSPTGMVKHNALYPLAQHGQLANFVQQNFHF